MRALTTPSNALPKRSEALSQNADAFINWLFDELAGTFPAWKAALNSQQEITTAKRIWFEALSENKIPLLSVRGKWLIKYRRGKMFKEDLKGYVALVAVVVFVMWANGGI